MPSPSSPPVTRPGADSSFAAPIVKARRLASITFTGQLGFRQTVNQRVYDFLETHNIKTRDLPAMYAKSAIVLLWWAASYGLWIASGIAHWPWVASLTFA